MAKAFYQCSECGKQYPYGNQGKRQLGGHNRVTGHRASVVIDDQGNAIDPAGLGRDENPDGDAALKSSTPAGSKFAGDTKKAAWLLFQQHSMPVPLTPIMLAVRKVAIEKWGFPPDVRWEDLIDSVFYVFAKDRMILVSDYIVLEEVSDARDLSDTASEGTRPDRAGEAVPVAG